MLQESLAADAPGVNEQVDREIVHQRTGEADNLPEGSIAPGSPFGTFDPATCDAPYWPYGPSERQGYGATWRRFLRAAGRLATAPFRPRTHGYVRAHHRPRDITEEYVWR